VPQPTLRRPTIEDLSAELMLLTGRLVRAVSRETSRASGSIAAQVPAASLRLLSQVEELAPVTIGALATADRCAQPTMSAGVGTLCERGWALKEPNPRDARSSLVSLTEAGRTVLSEARRERAASVAARLRADPRHDEHDVATAVAVLRGLLDQYDEPHEPQTREHQTREEGTP
jgi:DNA-binding MarR family transcriptional regulator